ncbi:hypothetical protein [Humidesulfovibrio mexicanus]|uniref:hypothetical protein n=1 Tax=Humidesulfovibrio mexicanus TaxID=147047 RepID=UPI001177F72D|nr:hypothetical protein [Humidesulfovibrio mexicanus]
MPMTAEGDDGDDEGDADENSVHGFSVGFVRFGNQSIAQTERRAQGKVIYFSWLMKIVYEMVSRPELGASA